MHDKFTALTPEVYAYLVDHRSDHDPVLAELARETHGLGDVSIMQIAPEQGAFLTMLVRLTGARSIVEVGTFTGYSALCLAKGLPADGRLLCCDVNREWTAIGRRYWEKAGVAGQIDLRLAPALETLQSLPREESFDLAFIDADKTSYAAYYEEILARTRPNGVVLFDNVLWSGAVADPTAVDDSTRALRALNAALARDERVEVVMLPIADGLTLARKKG